MHRVLALVGIAIALDVGCAASSPPRNVLLVTIDTLRADRLGCYGYAAARTPRIDEMARGGVLFEQAVAQAPLTLPSHASLFTGTFPPTHGVRDNVTYRVSAESVTLAEVMAGAGFQTAAFVGAYPLHRRFGLDQGFSHYDDFVGSQQDAPSGFFVERKGEAVVEAALRWLTKSDDSPFFLWVHLFDPHVPYDPPASSAPLPHPYDGEIAYVDSQLGRLFDALEAEGRTDDTLVVLTSDHGESLGEHGERTHGFFLYDATVRVPLILRHPSLAPGLRVAGQVRAVDVMPTVLDVLGIEVPPEVQGESFAAVFSGESLDRPAYAETYVPLVNFHWSPLRALRHEGWKYVDAPKPELYDLERDPGERKNLVEAEPLRAAKLREELSELNRGWPARAESAVREIPDEKTLAALRSLGYLGGSLPARADPTNLPDPKDRIGLWDLMEEELSHLTSGRYPEAIEVLKRVLHEDPGNLLALEHLGYAWYQLDRPRESLEAYRRLVELDPGRASGQVSLGSCLEKLGKREEARRYFRAAQEIDPTYAKAYVRMGHLLLEDGDGSGAEAEFQKALDLEGETLSARKGLARAHRTQGELDQAKAIYEEILTDSPDAGAMAELAEILLAEGRGEETRELVERALELDANEWKALYGRSVLRNRDGDAASAREDLERVVELAPEFAQAHHDLGVLYAREGDVEKAVSAYERAIEKAPNALSYNGLGTVYARSGKWEPAIEMFRRALELDPGYATAYENLAEVYRATGRDAEAEAVARRLEEVRKGASR